VRVWVLVLWGKVAALTADAEISVVLLLPRILRKGVFCFQNAMPFKQVNRRSTLPTKEAVSCPSCQLCSGLSWKVIRYVVLQKITFFPPFYRETGRAVILLHCK